MVYKNILYFYHQQRTHYYLSTLSTTHVDFDFPGGCVTAFGRKTASKRNNILKNLKTRRDIQLQHEILLIRTKTKRQIPDVLFILTENWPT